MAVESQPSGPSATMFTLRACCVDAPEGVGFVEIAGERGPLPARDAPTVVEGFARPAYESDRGTAYHEAGHALAALVAGGTVLRVTLRDPNPCAPARDVPRAAHAVLALAGPHAEGLARGWIAPIADPVVRDHLDRVAVPAGGFCDLCVACRACVHRAGLDDQENAYRLFRTAERATVRLLDHEMSRRFLRSTAHELLREGELSGDRVHAIADEILDPETLETLKSIIAKGA